MTTDMKTMREALTAVLADRLVRVDERLGEVTIVLKADGMLDTLTLLRDSEGLRFNQMIDLCGLDYLTYGVEDDSFDEPSTSRLDKLGTKSRFAVVYHLLSLVHNQRLRVRIFAEEDDLPVLSSVADIWPGANWFEREAFDLFGIIFTGHPDLRRILTDYGFVGNPFRKDFPLSGHVEMRYDPEQQRVVYQPVTVEPRIVTPRIMREDTYGSN